MAHAQKPDFVFRRNGRVHLNRWGRQFSRLLAADVRASAIVILDTPRSEVVWRVLATHSIRQFPLHFPYRASPCAITFQLDSNTSKGRPGALFSKVQHVQDIGTNCFAFENNPNSYAGTETGQNALKSVHVIGLSIDTSRTKDIAIYSVIQKDGLNFVRLYFLQLYMIYEWST